MRVDIEIVEPKIFDGVVADELVASIEEAIESKGTCSIVLVGGKTPSSLYRTLTKPPRSTAVEWEKLRLYWGDERWVPHSESRSNYKMTQETLLSQIHGKGVKSFPVDTSLASPEVGAKAYSDLICKLENVKAGELPVFDIVILGVGEDGHTASIFPGSPVLNMQGQLAYAVQHPEDKDFRITLAPDVLFSASKIFFIVKGENKAAIMKRVLEGDETFEVLPARLYTTAKGSVTWFLDSGAGKQLEKR